MIVTRNMDLRHVTCYSFDILAFQHNHASIFLGKLITNDKGAVPGCDQLARTSEALIQPLNLGLQHISLAV